MSGIRRRDFVILLGGAAAAWPLAARAQRPSIPVIGFLDATTAADTVYRVSAFRDGLKEAGFIDGHNVAIVFRWAEGPRVHHAARRRGGCVAARARCSRDRECDDDD